MHGNRDFLLGEAFAERVGATLHRKDEVVVNFGADGAPDDCCLLLHGDTLCTGDVDYQRLRETVRDPAWQRDFLARSPRERVEAATALRQRSQAAVAGKRGGIMDVAPEAVGDAFARHDVRTMIHGHTHRPHDHRAASGVRRLVVGDWHADHARYARRDGGRLTLQTWR